MPTPPMTTFVLPSIFPFKPIDPNGQAAKDSSDNSDGIPLSLYMSPIGEDRDRDREELEGTGSFRRRYDDIHPSPPHRKVEVPLALIISIAMYLIGHLVGSVWWAATLQSNVQHEMADRAREENKLWEKIEAQGLIIQKLEKDLSVNQALMSAGIRSRAQHREEN